MFVEARIPIFCVQYGERGLFKAFHTSASRGEPSPLRGSVEYTMPPKALKTAKVGQNDPKLSAWHLFFATP
jgi:hypothetical protein